MTPDVFAEWLRRQGHHVVRTDSTWWFDSGPRSYQAFPYHWQIHPAEAELRRFLRTNRAIVLRYSTSLEAPIGRLSYHVTYEEPEYRLEDLGKWARKNVRRGLKNCSVESIGFDRLAEEGWTLQEDTLARQNRSGGMSAEKWRTLCTAAADLPGFEAWAALIAGQLAATVITFRLDDCCYMLYQQCLREHLPAHVNNALGFAVTQTMIGREGIRSIFYALHSLDAPPTMDEFKLRLGYTAKPVRQRVVFHPLFSPFVNSISHAALKKLVTFRPSQGLLAKGEGMVRFFLEGKEPLERQSTPGVLAVSQESHDQDVENTNSVAEI